MFNGILAAESGTNISEVLTETMEAKTRLFGLEVSEGFVSALIVTLIVGIAVLILRLTVLRRYRSVPRGIGLILEKAVAMFDNIARSAVHSYSKYVAPLIFGTAVFIFVGTMVEIIGIHPVFADLNAGLALGIFGFFIIQILGLKKKGLDGRLKAQFTSVKGPFGIVLGLIKTLSDFILPFSMALRLYGSILSGTLIMALVYLVFEGLAWYFMPVSFAVQGLLSVVFTVFHAVIQAYVFGTLISLFTGESTE